MRYLSVLLVWISVMGWTTTVMAQQKEFYIATVHPDGKTSTKGDAAHPPEAFPTQSLPSGGGIVMRQPDAEGTWQIRAFVFQPAQLTVYQGRSGDTALPRRAGPLAHHHSGKGRRTSLSCGAVRDIVLPLSADKVGPIRYLALDRQPTMQGQVVVLPRP